MEPPTPTPTPTADDPTHSAAAATAANNAPSDGTNKAAISPEELQALVQAIKFAKTEASQRQVWKEISQELSQKPGFEFLSQVALNDVKKVWKKALKQQPTTTASANANPTTSINNATTQPSNNNNAENAAEQLKSRLLAAGSTPFVFTVGQLAQEYTAMTLAEASAGEQQAMEEMQGYVHVFLDVPADRSGNKPHQALISFQKKPSGTTSSSSSSKKDSKTAAAAAADPPTEGIVKIQKAAPMHPDDTEQLPMLVYNQSKTWKTFVHPDSDAEGYTKIATLIDAAGREGQLGRLGGTKAYFHARVSTPLKKQKGPSIVSIDVTELAPVQAW